MVDRIKFFVGGLSDETVDEDLIEHFRSSGEVLEAVVIKDKETGKTRNFGFLTMADSSSSDTILKVSHEIRGKVVRLRLDKVKAEASDQRKVYIANLEPHVSADAIKEVFSQFGEVVDVYTPKDESGERKRFGFVTFDTKEQCDAALTNGTILIQDIEMEIKSATPSRVEKRNGKYGTGFDGSQSWMTDGVGWNSNDGFGCWGGKGDWNSDWCKGKGKGNSGYGWDPMGGWDGSYGHGKMSGKGFGAPKGLGKQMPADDWGMGKAGGWGGFGKGHAWNDPSMYGGGKGWAGDGAYHAKGYGKAKNDWGGPSANQWGPY